MKNKKDVTRREFLKAAAVAAVAGGAKPMTGAQRVLFITVS